MRTHSMIVATIAAVFTATCAKRAPQPVGVASGTPYVSWIIMSGDSDNPDREFVCQSDPRSDCVIPARHPNDQVFSDVHLYYHGVGAEAKYTGTIDVGFFQGSPESHKLQSNIVVSKNESIKNQSVTSIVTATPGTYGVTFDLAATVTDTGKSQPIRDRVPIVVR